MNVCRWRFFSGLLVQMETGTRKLLFWLACLPLRAAVAVLAVLVSYRVPEGPLMVGTYAALTTSGFVWNAVLQQVGRKTRGGLGGEIWWTRWRLVHIVTWAACAIGLFLGQREASFLLALDVVLAAAAGAVHYAAR